MNDALLQLSNDMRRKNIYDRKQNIALAKQHNIPLQAFSRNSVTYQLRRFEDGRPLFYRTTNLNAAATVGVDRLWPGGNTLFGLTGLGITVGVWDAGPARLTHREFGNRGTAMDAATGMSNHATHVAGTVLSQGITLPAKGMAPGALLHSYDWWNDSAEMAAAAASGLRLSNHSYSYVVGWDLGTLRDGLWVWWGTDLYSTTEDWWFGFYRPESADWDAIAYLAPDYLIVSSAGNDRWDDGPEPGENFWDCGSGVCDTTRLASPPPDGDFDSLPSGASVAKNVLVVGAVEDIPGGYPLAADIVMTGYSSWGPADDGRIKPDIVANGSSLYSTTSDSDNSYGKMSGTSMAAPSVTGAMALLQEQFSLTHDGASPRSATLRAVVSHTAIDAGNEGPDYQFGWGLLDAAAAAQLIARDSYQPDAIQELTLAQGDTLSFTVRSSGIAPARITVAWTDPAGDPPGDWPGGYFFPFEVDPTTKMLVNDLDVRLIGGGETFEPWLLAVEYPEVAAVTGDNSVDNIEQVYLAYPAAGAYIVQVTSKGGLQGGSQDFSLIMTGLDTGAPPHVLVWEGAATADYSGAFTRDQLGTTGQAVVDYTTDFPASLLAYDAAYLFFGNYGDGRDRTIFDAPKQAVVREYLEAGGAVYLEGGDPLDDVPDTSSLLALFGISSADGGRTNVPDSLYGLPGTLAAGLVFEGYSDSIHANYIDIFTADGGTVAISESDYGDVGVEYTGEHDQRTFVFSYALGQLADGPAGTRAELLNRITNYLTVTGNHPPVLSALGNREILEDDSLMVTVWAFDPEGDPIHYTVTSNEPAVRVDMEGYDYFKVVPDRDWYGVAAITVIASDSVHATLQSFQITILPVNDAPVLGIPDTVRATVDSLFVFQASASDIDSDALTFTFSGYPSWLQPEGANTLTGTPLYADNDDFFVRVSDGDLIDLKEVTLLLDGSNQPPALTIDHFTTPEDTPVELLLSAFVLDPDDDSVTVARVVIPPRHGALEILAQNEAIRYTPTANYFGPDSTMLLMTDGTATVNLPIYLEVTPVNDTPGRFVMSAPGLDTTVSVTPEIAKTEIRFGWTSAIDADGDTVRYSLELSVWDSTHRWVTLDSVMLIPVADILYHFAHLAQKDTLNLTWTVWAQDASASTAVDEGPFMLRLDLAPLSIGDLVGLPETFRVHPNSPNPFNPETTIRLDLPESSALSISIYNIIGAQVWSEEWSMVAAGYHRLRWTGVDNTGRPVPSGIYLARIVAGKHSSTLKMMLLR